MPKYLAVAGTCRSLVDIHPAENSPILTCPEDMDIKPNIWVNKGTSRQNMFNVGIGQVRTFSFPRIHGCNLPHASIRAQAADLSRSTDFWLGVGVSLLSKYTILTMAQRLRDPPDSYPASYAPCKSLMEKPRKLGRIDYKAHN